MARLELNMCLRILLLKALFYFSTYTSSQLNIQLWCRIAHYNVSKVIMRSTFNVRLMSVGSTFWLKCVEGSQLLYSLPQKVFGAEMCPVPPRDLGLGNGHEGQGFGVPLELFHLPTCNKMLTTGDHFGMKDSLVYCRLHFETLIQGDFPSHFITRM